MVLDEDASADAGPARPLDGGSRLLLATSALVGGDVRVAESAEVTEEDDDEISVSVSASAFASTVE